MGALRTCTETIVRIFQENYSGDSLIRSDLRELRGEEKKWERMWNFNFVKVYERKGMDEKNIQVISLYYSFLINFLLENKGNFGI